MWKIIGWWGTEEPERKPKSQRKCSDESHSRWGRETWGVLWVRNEGRQQATAAAAAAESSAVAAAAEPVASLYLTFIFKAIDTIVDKALRRDVSGPRHSPNGFRICF